MAFFLSRARRSGPSSEAYNYSECHYPSAPSPVEEKWKEKWRVDGRTSELSFHSTLSICTWLWEMKSWWAALPCHRGLSAGRHIFSAAHFRPLTQSRGKEIRQETTNIPPWLALFVCTVLAASIRTVSEEDYLNHFVVKSTCHMLWAVNNFLSFWWMAAKSNMATFSNPEGASLCKYLFKWHL